MEMFNNSYDEYRKILFYVKSSGKLCSFEEARGKDEFIVLRHDVEFSIEKAHIMADIEKDYGVRTIYFIQIENDSYNAFSDVNRKLIKEIYDMGHEIGLHYRQDNAMNDIARIQNQIRMMEIMYGIRIKAFSTHRPAPETAYDKYNVNGIINAYSKEYFTRTDDVSKVEVKYISDSKYQWNYGYPSREAILSYNKLQLLVHPFQWSEEPLRMTDCFDRLLEDNSKKVRATYLREFTRLKEATDGCE